MANIAVCSSPSIQQYTPEHKMSLTQYPDSGLGLDYDSDTEEGDEEKMPSGETKGLPVSKPTIRLSSSPLSPEQTSSPDALNATNVSPFNENLSADSSSTSSSTTIAAKVAATATMTTTTTTKSTTSTATIPPQLNARLRRKFKKSRSDKLLRTVLKRAQNNVNKQLFPPQQLRLQHQQLKKDVKYSPPKPSQECMAKAKDYKDLKYMSAANLSRLIKRSNIENTSHTLIDCRIPLEFNRCNMKGSINLHTKEMVQHFYSMYYRGRNAPKLLIFYSNHVIDEALRMAYFLRTLDLKTHNSDHTKLVFPTVYLLNESFKTFQKKFPTLVQATTAL